MYNQTRIFYDRLKDKMKNILIVGTGFAGATCARVLAESGFKVKIIDKRGHIAGNAYDYYDEYGVLIHKYGPHIFHTNDKTVFEFLSRFTDWRFYEHRVLAKVGDTLYPIPINKSTINKLYKLNLNEEEVATYLEKVREPKENIKTSEDVVLNSIGSDLCEKFFRNYTKKQWGLDLSELSAGVASRIPTRTNDDDRYFTDSYQFMPTQGYTKMFERMLDHPNITIELNTNFLNLDKSVYQDDILVYTGSIDEFYEQKFGALPYRSLKFTHQHFKDINQFQETGTVNYPNDFEYTRITEFKHLNGQKHKGTSIIYEYPEAIGEPYYPIPRQNNQDQYQKYETLAKKDMNVHFVGRLAQYRYYNMDQVIAAAQKTARSIINSY